LVSVEMPQQTQALAVEVVVMAMLQEVLAVLAS